MRLILPDASGGDYERLLETLDPEDALKPDSDWCPPGPGEWTPDLQRYALAMLRVPFPTSAQGLLPKAYKRDDPDKSNCDICGGYHAAGIHLDYVGHAAVTDRLLTVDPWWNWEPASTDEEGLPILDRGGNMWIRLTIAEVTRLGYGDGADAKVRIGDAIRNAGLRFGIATYLWTKDELESLIGSEKPTRRAPPKGSKGVGDGDGRKRVQGRDPRTAGKTQLHVDDRNKISAKLSELKISGPAIPQKLGEILGVEAGVSLSKLTTEDGPTVFEALGIALKTND
jgi:hypothetical protein